MPETTCRFCNTYSRVDRVFCLNCNKRLVPLPPTGLSADDFASPGDKSNLDALKGTEPVPHLVEKLVSPGREKSEAWLSTHGFRIRPPSRLDTLIRACGEVLGIDELPRAYVAPVRQVNAFTAGRDNNPLLVICSPALNVLSYTEIEGLIAHELAHVRSKHVLYHTLAESIASGAQIAASALAAGLATVPIRMLLLSWYRESELSADRAAILVLAKYQPFESLMANLMRSSPRRGVASNEDEPLTELLETHPNFSRRLRLAKEFADSPEYWKARLKLLAASTSWSLASICRYCGLMVPRREPFCPSCGRSRA